MIGTASGRNAAFLRELGADEVLDYNSVHFEDEVRDADVVLDTVGGDTLQRSWGVLKQGGILVTVAGDAPEDKAAKYGVRGTSFTVQPNRGQLTQISQLIDSRTIRPIVEDIFLLARARDAYERGLLGHNRGKLVLQITP